MIGFLSSLFDGIYSVISDPHFTLAMKIRVFLSAISLLVISSLAHAGIFGIGGTIWKEAVLLHDGGTIVVARTVERGGRHEIGQEPPIKEQSLAFTMPGTNENVVWHDKFTEDIGGANFLPMYLEIRKDSAYLVVYPMGCVSYEKWGRPNPPYVVFRYQAKEWRRIALQELPNEFNTPNLIFSSPDHEAKKIDKAVVSPELIRALYNGYRQPEYKTILREPLAREQCPRYSSGPKAPMSIPQGNASSEAQGRK